MNAELGSHSGDRKTATNIVATAPEIWIQDSEPYENADRLAQQILETATIYLIERTQDACTREAFRSAAELQARLDAGKITDSQRLIVVHGLPLNYVEVLRGELDIDAEFIEAHARRRSYRPSRRAAKIRSVSFDYPELVTSTGLQPTVSNEGRRLSDTAEADVMGNAPKCAISKSGDEAVFCRASLWISETTNVLFLDRPLWREPSSLIVKARQPFSVTRPCECTSSKQRAWHLDFVPGGKDVDSLQHRLWDALGEEILPRANLVECLSRIAFDHWIELLEVVSFETQRGSSDLPALFWQMQRSLESNLYACSFWETSSALRDYAQPDWKALLDRVERTAKLMIQLNPTVTTVRVPMRDLKTPKQPKKGDSTEKYGSSDSKANQQSLDRVSYLGGILLPISIVSGILSMGDTFGPYGDKFFVFWAVAMPLTLLTLLIIYADSIRKAEVWIEVAVGDQGSNPNTDVSPGPKPGMNLQPRIARITTPQLEQAIQFSYNESTPIENRVDEALANDEIPERQSEPELVVHQRFGHASHGQWKKEELGWLGAGKTILQIYKLKKTRGAPTGAARSRGWRVD
ncbi:uncharacterized protein BCR38DRAFT_356042 [Pseudomassariella vexata]|uniref:Uncharacterized protein n=1 Tax=Pseudomassariella vexata TaxID=1141098 RepID=A0A1Y2DA83_9PEZI|nr:uncharacterized protein BCR38DRAFT_356042 [Pseudomassariella vexata]ORY56064.1 hypothetical protein BCR38DRAFT_356042 [Pseudomassariella vexata]